MTKMEISSQMTNHSMTKVSGVTSKSSQIATFLVVLFMQEMEYHMSIFGLSSGHAMQEDHEAPIAYKYKMHVFPKGHAHAGFSCLHYQFS
jgi:hypothetical protein